MIKKIKKQYYKIFPKKFGNYWNKIRANKTIKIDEELKLITNLFINSNSYKYVSRQWHILNINNYNTLINYGINKYGSTIARNYYTFTDAEEEHLKGALKKIDEFKDKSVSFELLKKHNNLSNKESLFYNCLCMILFLNLKKTDSFNYIKILNDKTYLGYDDPFLKIENFNITIDKLVSLLDYDKINRAFELKKINTVLEIGAGSGRTSEVLLTINDKLKYIICDIPPAIYIAYKRLKIAFPNKKIKLLIDIEESEELKRQIIENDITFIFPHHLEFFKKNFIDLTVAIDCFHEMDKKTISFFFKNINNLTSNFYFSIWSKTKNYYSKTLFKRTEKLEYDKGDYQVPSNWENHFRENLVFPSNQLGLGFKIIDK